MGLALTLARRSLLSRPGRTLFSTLGIALGVATVVGVVVLDFNTVEGLRAGLGRDGNPDVQMRMPSGRGDTTELYQVEGVSLAARYFQQDATARLEPISEVVQDDPEARERVRLFGIDALNAPALDVYSLAEGEHLAVDGRRHVLVGQTTAERFDLEIGSTLWLSRPKRVSNEVCENGQLVERRNRADSPVEWDFRVVGILTREALGRRTAGNVVVVDYPNGVELYDSGQVHPMVWATRDETVEPEKLKASLARVGGEVSDVAILGQAADEKAFRMGVRMAGLLALVLGLYVIFHTLSMSLKERMKEVGTLHALGSTKGQIGRVFLLEAVVLALVGALLGALGGLALAKGLLVLGITTLGTGKHIETFLIPWGTVGALAGIGFAIALIGSVYPLFTLRGASTVAVLRGEGDALQGRSRAGFHLLYALLLAVVLPGLYMVVLPVTGGMSTEMMSTLLGALGFLSLVIVLSLIMPAVLAGVCSAVTRPFTALWPLAGRMTARAVRAAPARIGVCTAALALVTAGFVGLKGMTNSLAGEVDQWAAEAVLDKVFVRNMPPANFAALASRLHDYPGVVAVEKGGIARHEPYLVQGVDVDELARFGPLAADAELVEALRAGTGMIISRRLAEDAGLEVGMEKIFENRDSKQQRRVKVVAITDAYGHFPDPDERMYGLVADDLLEDLYCMPTDAVVQVAISVEPGTDQSIVEAAVFDFHGQMRGIQFRSGAEVLDAHLRDIRKDFILFDVLLGLTAVLAGLGVLNGQLLAALERAKELGVLKALGTSRGQLAGMVLLEALVVGLVGGLLGTAIGFGLTQVVVDSLRSLVGLDLPHVGPRLWALWGFLGCVIVALLSALYPMWRTTRVDGVRAVRMG
ncbi:MAG: ABC transporter permease [Planctomycetota bacterium]|nr:ABC transporter permease [Planctomycetota bacterium]